MRNAPRTLLGLAFAAMAAAPALAADPQEIRTDPRMPVPAPRLQDGPAPAAAPSSSPADAAPRPASAPRRALQAAQRGIDDTAQVKRRTTMPRPQATPRQRPIAP